MVEVTIVTLVKSNNNFSNTAARGFEEIKSAVAVALGRRSRSYTTGRILRFAVFAKLKIEGRDRTLARAGPTADFISSKPEPPRTSNLNE